MDKSPYWLLYAKGSLIGGKPSLAGWIRFAPVRVRFLVRSGV